MKKKNIQAKITNLHGTTMMAVDKIRIKDGAIVMTGNIMGTMPGSFYLTPEEMWKMVKMINWKLICSVPMLLFNGRRTYLNNIKGQNMIK